MSTSTANKADKEDSGKTATTGPTKVSTGDLLLEATSLLKSLRMPSVSVMQLTKLQEASEWILLDSGATHGLRPASDQSEWEQSIPTKVQLAEGETTKLRIKPGTRVFLSEPGTSMAWIVPLGGIAELGYKFEWSGNQCKLSRGNGEVVPMEVCNGCPMISRLHGGDLLRMIEQRQIAFVKRWRTVQELYEGKRTVDGQMTMDEALLVKLYSMFPDLPKELLMRIIPEYHEKAMDQCGALLPWNRRKRRRLAKAKQIVLHLFSGPDSTYWEKSLGSATTEVLCVDIMGNVKAGLHDPLVFWYVMSLAAAKKIKVVMAGPPCRTVSALRCQNDGGRAEVRSEEFPYGLPGISPEQREMVLQDSALWFRTLLIYAVCEDAQGDEPQTSLILEQPEDPKNYRSPQEGQEKKFMSVWRTQEWKIFQEKFNIKMISFDQGGMGHECRKPTTLAITLDELCQLDGLRGSASGGGNGEDRRSMSLRDRCQQSKQWAAWAPGLKAAMVIALRERLQGEHGGSPLSATALQQWKQH